MDENTKYDEILRRKFCFDFLYRKAEAPNFVINFQKNPLTHTSLPSSSVTCVSELVIPNYQL